MSEQSPAGEVQGARTATLRMRVTDDEHAALYRYARVVMNTTVDMFLRMAVSEYVNAHAHVGLEEMARRAASAGKLVQGDLFDG